MSSISVSQEPTPALELTQVVGHGNEAEAGDVGVVAGLVELLLGCVVTGEALGRFCRGRSRNGRWVRRRTETRTPSRRTHQLVETWKDFLLAAFPALPKTCWLSAPETQRERRWRYQFQLAGKKRTKVIRIVEKCLQWRPSYFERLSWGHQLCVQKSAKGKISEYVYKKHPSKHLDRPLLEYFTSGKHTLWLL